MSGKYDALRDHLMALRSPSVSLTFKEIEAVLQVPLPPSARSHVAWWANEQTDSSYHVQCRAWQSAGFSAFPDLKAEIVTFRRSGAK